MTRPDRNRLLKWLASESERGVSGWDFSHLQGRMHEEKPSWDYSEIVRSRLKRQYRLLDIGTGGGEVLSGFVPLPASTCATEAYRPNVTIARSRLSPLGVSVVQTGESGDLPFRGGTFDLVISRHSFYQPPEVMRVLRPGGWFITQQVGSRNNRYLNTALNDSANGDANEEWDLAIATDGLEAAGLTIDRAKEEFPLTRFTDAGALVSYLAAIPWQLPDFTVDRYAVRLLSLHRRIERDGYLDCRGHRFLLVCRKAINK